MLIAAAWLHDIGKAAPLREHGFHSIDGARYLCERGWPAAVYEPVAHHSGAPVSSPWSGGWTAN